MTEKSRPTLLTLLAVATVMFSCQAIVKFKDPPYMCGDNTIQNWEQCDGPNLDNHSCESLGEGTGTLNCTQDCQFDVSECVLESCGNDQRDPGEECEGQDLNGQTCESRGYSSGTLACLSTCHFDVSGCVTGVCQPDNYCDPAGETRETCPQDCNSTCNNGTCEIGHGESPNGNGTWETCFEDCRWHRISAGAGHTCALMFDGSGWCWGDNYDGQLGSSDGPSAVPVQVETNVKFVEIAAGANHTCAVDDVGRVWCWGGNRWGQLGNGTSSDQPTIVPVEVQSIVGEATAIAAGNGVSCAATTDGSGFCWGINQRGELGVGGPPGPETCGTEACSRFATPVPVPERIDDVSIGLSDGSRTHVCARSVDGHAWCWGTNPECENGHDSGGMDDATPVLVPGLEGLNTVAAGETFGCARNDFGTYCWGSDTSGQLGNGNGGEGSCLAPLETVSIDMVHSVAAGGKHCCVWAWQGSVWCWGDNPFGQTGDGNFGFNDGPFLVDQVDRAVVVSAGLNHTCAIQEVGTAVCWGDNFAGQLGNGTSNNRSYDPVLVLDPERPWSGARR